MKPVQSTPLDYADPFSTDDQGVFRSTSKIRDSLYSFGRPERSQLLRNRLLIGTLMIIFVFTTTYLLIVIQKTRTQKILPTLQSIDVTTTPTKIIKNKFTIDLKNINTRYTVLDRNGLWQFNNTITDVIAISQDKDGKKSTIEIQYAADTKLNNEDLVKGIMQSLKAQNTISKKILKGSNYDQITVTNGEAIYYINTTSKLAIVVAVFGDITNFASEVDTILDNFTYTN
jgi:hypothetical protein